jgi:hypothetical protein
MRTKTISIKHGAGRPTGNHFNIYIGTPDSASGSFKNRPVYSLYYECFDSEAEKDFEESLIEENI